MMCLLRGLHGRRRGATAIEYGLIAGLIALAVITSVATIGTNLSTYFLNVVAVDVQNA